jgi:predicted branched-subunit amino acid permease
MERAAGSSGTDFEPTTFTISGVMRGIRDSIGLAFSVLIYGIMFGLLAKTAAMSLSEAMLMSAVVYSGSAQMVAVNAIEAGRIPVGTAAFAVATTILLLNARYMLYGAAIRPWLAQCSPLQAYGTLMIMGDGSWILSMKAYHAGERDAGYLFGSSALMFIPWLAGTAIGVLAAAFAANPRALGLDFMLVAFSAALAAGLVKGRDDVAALVAASIAAVAADRFLPAGFAVMAAAAAGGLTAWLRFREQPAS